MPPAGTVRRAPDSADSGSRSPFRADIEGLRALAVLLVVAFHAGVPFVSGGFVGVDVFFVISGYLITSLLIAELSETGTISLSAFFARRIRRLLPAAIVVLVASLALAFAVLPPLRTIDVASSARAAAAYASNVHFHSLASDYFSGDVKSNPILHTWSLAVEEQFYLAWPFILLLFAARPAGNHRRLGWALAALAVASFVGACWYTTANRSLAFYATPLRAWEFCVGGITSLATHRLSLARGSASIGWLGFALVLAAATLYSHATEFPGATALVPVVGTSMLLATGRSRTRAHASTLLGAPPMQWIGRRSYSWYLWHWPVLVLAIALFPDLGVPERMAAVLISLALADLTYRYVETPMRLPSGAPRLSPDLSWRAVRLGLAATVAMFAVSETARQVATAASRSPSQLALTTAAADVASPHRDGCVTGARDDRVRLCSYGDSTAATTVVLYGDSHAVQWFPALEAMARSRGWSLVVVAKTRCATAEVRVYEVNSPALSLDCGRWRRAAMDSILARRPAFVVLANASVYVDWPAPGRGMPAASASEWEVGIVQTLRTFQARGIPTVTIRDTPVLSSNVPACLARSGWVGRWAGVCATDRSRAFNSDALRAEDRALAAVPGSARIDLTDVLCLSSACPAMLGNLIGYSDNEHLTASAARHLEPSLSRALSESEIGRLLMSEGVADVR